MKRTLPWSLIVAAMLIALPASAAIVEDGDLNIIDDITNPSNGLRYLDMSFSDGLTLADALINAQAVYDDARLATPSEWDDLFAAAGVTYSGAETASDAFDSGATTTISTDGSLKDILGETHTTGVTWIWSDPDGDIGSMTTRDLLRIADGETSLRQNSNVPPTIFAGYLLVSEVVVPLPPAFVLLGSGLLGLAMRRRTKRPASA